MINSKTIAAALVALVPVMAHSADDIRVFECTFEPAIGTSLVDGKFVQKPVGFKDKTTPWVYRFSLASAKPGSDPIKIKIDSNEDFATINGAYQAFAVAPETYVASVLKMDNCMFSSQICGASIQLTNLDSEKSAAAITPISYFGDQRDAEFFHVVLVGKCTKLAVAERAK